MKSQNNDLRYKPPNSSIEERHLTYSPITYEINPKNQSLTNLQSLNLIPKLRINSPIPRNNLPFQLNLHRLLLLDIHKIPSHSPRIRIPQNPIPFLLLPSHG